jgi:hypothetical protein
MFVFSEPEPRWRRTGSRQPRAASRQPECYTAPMSDPVYGLRRRPSEKQVLRIGERWRPYRSIASWYLWAALDNQ